MKSQRRIMAESLIEAHRFACSLRDNPDLAWAISDDLCGACAISAAWLHQRLQQRGIEDSRVVVADSHAYVRVGEWYLDPTCEQFGYPRHMGLTSPDRKAGDRMSDWHPQFSTSDLNDLVMYMEQHSWGWDAEQIMERVIQPARRRAA